MNVATLTNSLKALFGTAASSTAIASTDLVPFMNSSGTPSGLSSISQLASVLGGEGNLGYTRVIEGQVSGSRYYKVITMNNRSDVVRFIGCANAENRQINSTILIGKNTHEGYKELGYGANADSYFSYYYTSTSTGSTLYVKTTGSVYVRVYFTTKPSEFEEITSLPEGATQITLTDVATALGILGGKIKVQSYAGDGLAAEMPNDFGVLTEDRGSYYWVQTFYVKNVNETIAIYARMKTYADASWPAWRQVDNFGANSLSDLATALGVRKIGTYNTGQTLVIEGAVNQTASGIITTGPSSESTDASASMLSFVAFCGYGKESARNKLINHLNSSSMSVFGVSKSKHAIYVKNISGVKLQYCVSMFQGTSSDSIYIVSTSTIESDFEQMT